MPFFLYFLLTSLLGALASWVALRGKRDLFPNVVQAVALILAGFFFQQTVFAVAKLIVHAPSAPIESGSALALWSSLAFYGAPVILGFWGAEVSKKDLMGWFTGFNFPVAVYSILIGLGLLSLSALLTHTLRTTGLPTLPFWKPSLSGLLFAPIFEELLFRGLILRGLLKSRSKTQAIIISSLLFALVHGDVARIPALSVSGIVYAVIAIESGTLLYPILAHGAYNGAVHLFVGLGAFMPGLDNSESFNQFLTGSFVVLGVFALFRLREHFRPTPLVDG